MTALRSVEARLLHSVLLKGCAVLWRFVANPQVSECDEREREVTEESLQFSKLMF